MKLPFQQAQNHKNPTAHYTAMLVQSFENASSLKICRKCMKNVYVFILAVLLKFVKSIKV
jgi:hypothetical protein